MPPLPAVSGALPARKTFALLHIPKCAGTSLMSSIERGFGAGRHVNGFDRCLFGNFRQFETIPKMMRSVIHLDRAEMPDAATVMGHFSFSTLHGRYPDADIAIFMREPVVRLLSHWIYWRSLTWSSLRHWGPEWPKWIKQSRLPLQQFLANPGTACQTDNIVTRMLVWPHQRLPEDGFIEPGDDAVLLAIAQDNLRKIGFAGIMERGGQGYHELSAWLDIALDLPKLNPARRMRRTGRTRMNDELDPVTLDLLRQRTRLDLQLWQEVAAQKLSEAQVETLREDSILRAIARYTLLLN